MFFRGRLPKNKIQFIGTCILLILLNLWPEYHHQLGLEYHKQLSTVCCAAKSEWSQSPEADERSVVKISSGSTCCSSEQGLGVGLASFSLNFPLIYSGTGGAKPVHTCKPYIYIEDSSTQRLASMQTQQ